MPASVMAAPRSDVRHARATGTATGTAEGVAEFGIGVVLVSAGGVMDGDGARDTAGEDIAAGAAADTLELAVGAAEHADSAATAQAAVAIGCQPRAAARTPQVPMTAAPGRDVAAEYPRLGCRAGRSASQGMSGSVPLGVRPAFGASP